MVVFVRGVLGIVLDGEVGVEVVRGKLWLVGSIDVIDWKVFCFLVLFLIDWIFFCFLIGGSKFLILDLNVFELVLYCDKIEIY